MLIILRIYDCLKSHRALGVLSLLCVTLLLVLLVARQRYQEDIGDFLPLNNKYHQAIKVYQDISGANRVFAVFRHADGAEAEPDSLTQAVDRFVALLAESNKRKMISSVVSQVDMEQMTSVADFTYANIPYFLTDADYQRIDSMMQQPDYIPWQMAHDKQMLLFPVSGLTTDNLQRDPLNLFTPVVSRLQQGQRKIDYENYEGYIFSPDMQRAVVMMESPYGASETEHNAQLVDLLETCAHQVEQLQPSVSIHLTGGPAIAVGNARQIKADSRLAVTLAVILIVALLFVAFRHVWNILLIVVSIGWGWFFAMGMLALIRDSVSVIVIGISSVILGIAVNYPLHLIAHLQHTPDIKSALREIVVPLVVGNITTVGAFLALVPLQAVALRDLGLFSSLLLTGTIVFVLLYLPHLVCKQKNGLTGGLLHRVSGFTLDNKRWVVYGVLLTTVVLGYFSLDTTFATNMNTINYMTDEQRQDMAAFLPSTAEARAAAPLLYVVSTDSTLEGALSQSQQLQPFLRQLQAQGRLSDIQTCTPFLASRDEQRRRLARWQTFVSRYGHRIETEVRAAARQEGFSDDAFDHFFSILHNDYEPQEIAYFNPLASTVFASSFSDQVSECGDAISVDSVRHHFSVVDVVQTDADAVASLTEQIDEYSGSTFAFDVESMNSSIAKRLSDDFNYIGCACGLIVFFFLWASLGCIELAILSFLPMAVSWVWILGLMGLLGIQFNVVNVILATFIFGQGDDYTIFMTEGCQYEYAYRRRMLASYKYSIMLSALIMFIGIGTLILAKHPALRSLAEVTIVGMSSVVLMAWLLPPLLFGWLVRNRQGYRRRPITLRNMLFGVDENDLYRLVADRYRYRGADIASAVRRHLRQLRKEISSSTNQLPSAFITDDYGESALLMALMHPDQQVTAVITDPDRLVVARHAADELASNLTLRALDI